jgi:hypothetical protein
MAVSANRTGSGWVIVVMRRVAVSQIWNWVTGTHQRAALTLRYLDGLQVREVGEILDRSGSPPVPDRFFGGCQQAPVISGLMSPTDGEPNRDHESKPEAPDPAAQPPTRLREAAAGMAEAQAWKGQQISRGWRKLMDSLRRPRPPSQ